MIFSRIATYSQASPWTQIQHFSTYTERTRLKCFKNNFNFNRMLYFPGEQMVVVKGPNSPGIYHDYEPAMFRKHILVYETDVNPEIVEELGVLSRQQTIIENRIRTLTDRYFRIPDEKKSS